MKKTCFLLLTVLLTTAALRASAQNKDTSKENFPSTETTLSQIGQAEAHPNARHVRMADTSALAAPVKRPGLIRRIIDYYSRSNVDRTFEKKIDWSIAPGPNYSSDVGFGIGFLLAGLYRLDRTDSVTAPSNISIYGNFTTEKFVLLRFSGDNIYNHNKQRLSYSGAFVYFPGAFYGVGYNAGKEGYAQDLTTTMGAFRISYCTSLVGRFYIGVSGGIDYSGAKYKNSGMADRMNGIQADVESGKPVPGGKMGELYNLWQEGRYDPAKQDPFSNYIATTGDKPNAFNANVGLFAQYDTRDVTFNASKGIFIKAEAKWYPEWLGNTRRTFGRFTLTFDFYQKLWKGAVLACDLYADATAGTPSWHMYAKMGGMERMRGYYEGRYRDKKLVETQIELRQKIYRRHGIVGWIGGGQVWGTEKFRWGNTLCSFGCGYRFEFKNRMNHPPRLRLGQFRQPESAVGPQAILGVPVHRFGSILKNIYEDKTFVQRDGEPDRLSVSDPSRQRPGSKVEPHDVQIPPEIQLPASGILVERLFCTPDDPRQKRVVGKGLLFRRQVAARGASEIARCGFDVHGATLRGGADRDAAGAMGDGDMDGPVRQHRGAQRIVGDPDVVPQFAAHHSPPRKELGPAAFRHEPGCRGTFFGSRPPGGLFGRQRRRCPQGRNH